MAWNFEQVAGPVGFTEGPVWTGEAVLFTDMPGDRIMRYDPETGACDVWRTGTNMANGLTLDAEGRLYGAEGTFDPLKSHFIDGPGRRIARYEADGSTTGISEHFDGKRFNSPNDLVVDARERVWFTDPRYGDDRSCMEHDHESVYRADPQADGSYTTERVTFDTTKPNGLIVTPDMQTLYVAQSDHGDIGPRQLRAYPIAEDGSAGAFSVLHDFGPDRGIDGMRLDSQLNIVATAGWPNGGPGPMIYVFAPDGQVLEQHPFPIDPTNCAFGDADLQGLYVTAKDGYLYHARTHRRRLA
ncbi:MAG: SMP-30/gluconolactonase/LRE family protein [Candidatus Latescibacteria bacterium]|nr:SMP-30/gluconolactonase/LRE family protein [Candidatus Latescibacterota bacterium]